MARAVQSFCIRGWREYCTRKKQHFELAKERDSLAFENACLREELEVRTPIFLY